MEAKENVRKREYLQNKLGNLEAALKSERERLERLKAQLEKENTDVERLEKTSLSALLYTVLGKKEERLDKERQEYFTAKLKYEECRNSVQALEDDTSYTRNSLKQYTGCENEYEELLKEKENYILQGGGESAGKLFENSSKIADVQADIRELGEALQAGVRASDALLNVYNSLKSAKDWGTWDMFGGGFISTNAKYSDIDDANEYAVEAQALLRAFGSELKDVNLNYNITLNIGEFDRFADYFFDGILADWSVQSKIEESVRSVEIAIDGVNRVIGTLKARLDVDNSKLKVLEEEAVRLIEAIS